MVTGITSSSKQKAHSRLALSTSDPSYPLVALS